MDWIWLHQTLPIAPDSYLVVVNGSPVNTSNPWGLTDTPATRGFGSETREQISGSPVRDKTLFSTEHLVVARKLCLKRFDQSQEIIFLVGALSETQDESARSVPAGAPSMPSGLPSVL
ncbi:hypothetical protein BHM03_00030455 [Ensete ventricosum]|nr:hypothetical protein BHM03_00030455 [Ensete ventricosum]